MFISLSLTVIQLGTYVVQTSGIDAVRLSVHGADQFFGSEFFENGERAVAEQQPFAGIALNGGDAARSVAGMGDASALGENVQGTLFLTGNIHAEKYL
jgi:hypothetical protein